MRSVSARQLLFIVALSRISDIVVFMPVLTEAAAFQDAWISAILSTVIAVLLAFFLGSLMMRFPGRSFGGIARESLGLVLGIPVALLVGVFYFLILLIRLKALSYLMITSALPEAPDWIFFITGLFLAVYGARLGAKAMGRVSEFIITGLVMGIFLGFVLLSMSPAEPDIFLLQPVLSRGIEPVLAAVVAPLFWHMLASGTVLGLGKFCYEPHGIRRAVVAGSLISGAILFSLTITVLMYLGPEEATRQFSPLLSLARVGFVLGVFERFDILVATIWILGVLFDATIMLLVASVIVGDSLGLRTGSVVIVLGFTGLLVSRGVVDVFRLERLTGPGISQWVVALMVGLLSLVYLASILRGKGKAAGR